MNKSKNSPLTAFLLFTLIIYLGGFFGTKRNYTTIAIIVVSMVISLLILLVLIFKKYDIVTDCHIIYGTIGMNNAILCAVLNSINIGNNLTQQVIALVVHIVIFISIIIFLEFCFGKKRHIKNSKIKKSVSTSLITLLISIGLFISRCLLRQGIDIRVVAGLSCGFLANTMFYIFLIYERLSRMHLIDSDNQSDNSKTGDSKTGDGSMS